MEIVQKCERSSGVECFAKDQLGRSGEHGVEFGEQGSALAFDRTDQAREAFADESHFCGAFDQLGWGRIERGVPGGRGDGDDVLGLECGAGLGIACGDGGGFLGGDGLHLEGGRLHGFASESFGGGAGDGLGIEHLVFVGVMGALFAEK